MRKNLAGILLLVWLCAAGMQAQVKPDDSMLVITNVNVVDVVNGSDPSRHDSGD